MSNKLWEAFDCEICAYHGPTKDQHGQQIEREYDDQTVCVSCYIDLQYDVPEAE